MRKLNGRIDTRQDVLTNVILFSFISLVLLGGFVLALPSMLGYGPSKDESVLILSAGGNGTPYSVTANQIASAFNEVSDSVKILAVPSSGSVQNVDRLNGRTADMAIVQRDVVIDAFYHNEDPIKNIEILYPLFEEKLQIFVYDTAFILPFGEFLSRIIEGSIKSFAIGEHGSTTNQTVRQLISLLGYSVPEDVFIEDPSALAVKEFVNGTIDAYAFFAASPIPSLSDIECNEIAMVSFEPQSQDLILSRLVNLNEVSINGKDYKFLAANAEDGIVAQSIGTWAFLVGLKGIDGRIQGHAGKRMGVLLSDFALDRRLLPYVDHYLETGLTSRQLRLRSLDGGVKAFKRDRLFKGMRAGGAKSWSLLPSVFQSLLLIVIVSLVLVFLYWIGKKRQIDWAIYWYRYRHFVFSALLFMSLYWLITSYVINREYQYYQATGVKSEVLDLTPSDLRRWLLLYVITGREANIFPISQEATFAVAASFNLIWFFAIASIGAEFVVNSRLKDRRMGKISIKTQGHHVICGWNHRCDHLIKTALHAKKEYLNGDSSKIVLINDQFDSVLDSNRQLKKLHSKGRIEFVKGDAVSREVLQKANIDKASTVVLLSEGMDQANDEKTLLRALSVSRYCRNKSKASIDSIYMIAEIHDESFKPDLESADVNEVVCVGSMNNNMLVQGMFNHGISDVLSEVLSYNKYNEFYTIDCRDYPFLWGRTFDDLMVELRRFNILLIGIKIVHYDKDGKERIDKDELAELNRDAYQVDRSVLINPATEDERKYQADNDDQLIVFAQSMDSILALKKRTP